MLKATEQQLIEFKKLLKQAVNFEDQISYENMDLLPDEYYERLFENFENNLTLARNIMFNDYKSISFKEFEEQINKINSLNKAAEKIKSFLISGKPMVCITDNDNDGSLSQAVLIETKRLIPEETKNFDVLFAQNINKEKSLHGITPELVSKWAETKGLTANDEFLVMTADNGIQSKEVTDQIQKEFPRAVIVITDHHLPHPERTPEENSKLFIVDPKYKPKGMFETELNISGAHTLAALMRKTITLINPEKANFEVIKEIENVSNLLDFVYTDIRAYPIKIYQAEKFNNLRALLNINNSVKSFVTKDIVKDDLKILKETSPEIDIETIYEAIVSVQQENVKAAKLLLMKEDFYKMGRSAQQIATEDLFRQEYIQILNSDKKIEHFNTNYIEQLRPYIFHTLVNPNKSSYESALAAEMEDVFNNLKKSESKIVNELRKAELMHVFDSENSTILYPKDFRLLKIFDRKLLMKVYNLNIKGTMITFTHESRNKEILGSFRSIGYTSSDLAKDTNELFKEVSVDLKGHLMAAGIILSAKGNKEVDVKTIERFNQFLNQRIEEYNSTKKISNDEKYVFVDPTTISMFKEINNVTRGFIANKNKIEPLFKLSRSSYFTDKDTGKEISVSEMLKKHKYGYHTRVEINFHGDVVIIPQEMTRQLSENNFKDYLQLTYTNDGVFLANKVIKSSEIKPSQIIKMNSGIKDVEKELTKYYEEVMIPNNYEVELKREEVKDMPFFTRNKYGLREFDRVEESILSIIDRQGLDKYVVVDVEANGLGKPQLFNFGTLDIEIKKDSGVTIPLKEYLYYASDNDMKLLEEEILNGEKLRNIKIDSKEGLVHINRELKYTLFSVLCRDTDFKLLDKLTYLTHISQSTLNKYGMKTSEVDNLLVKRYEGFKCTFGAHNSMYDYNVASVNLPKFYDLSVKENFILDTAKFAKSHTLGFSDLKVTILDRKYSEALFFNHPFADYSLTKMLESKEDFVYPSIRNDFILKRRGETLFLIDKRDNTEEELPETSNQILEGMIDVSMPLNRVKYAVQFLLQYENIRAMLLDNIQEKVKTINVPDYLSEVGMTDSLFKEFCKGYNFEADLEKNVLNFSKFLKYNLRESDFNLFSKILFESKPADEMILSGGKEELERRNEELLKNKAKELTKLEKDFANPKKNISQEDYEAAVKKVEDSYDSKLNRFTNYDQFVKGVGEFLLHNKNIYLKYTNNWEYRLLLSCYDPKKPTINKDELQIVHYKTSLPKERIKEMVKEIYDYKKKLGIHKEGFYVHEKHYNMGADGDAAIEFLLLMQRACSKHYNRYGSNDYNGVVEMVNQATLETTYQAIRKYYFENILKRCNIGSGSYKQMAFAFNSRQDTEGNKHSSTVIENAKNAEKIQLQSKFLGQGINILADKKLSEVTYEGLKEIKEDLDFVVNYMLLRNSKLNIKNINVSEVVNDYVNKENKMELYSKYRADLDSGLSSVANYTEEESAFIKSIEEMKEKYEKINAAHSDIFNGMLDSLDSKFVDSFKKVYDKIGFFYVTREEQQMKDLIDNIFETYMMDFVDVKKLGKIKTEYITEEQRDIIIEMSAEIAKKIDELNAMNGVNKISEDVKIKLNEGLQNMRTIDKTLSEYRIGMEAALKDPEVDFDTIYKNFIFEVAKKYPEKEFLENYDLIKNEIVRKQLKSKLKDQIEGINNDEIIIENKGKKRKP